MDFCYENDRVFLQDDTGKIVAEVTFPAISPHVVNINHTFVEESLRGQGIAEQLVKAAAERLRSEGKLAYPTCSYAVKWFEKNRDYADVYTAAPDL